jgi:hypothetical protein
VVDGIEVMAVPIVVVVGHEMQEIGEKVGVVAWQEALHDVVKGAGVIGVGAIEIGAGIEIGGAEERKQEPRLWW